MPCTLTPFGDCVYQVIFFWLFHKIHIFWLEWFPIWMRQVVVKDDFFHFLQINTSKFITFFKDLQDFSGFFTYISKLPKIRLFSASVSMIRLVCYAVPVGSNSTTKKIRRRGTAQPAMVKWSKPEIMCWKGFWKTYRGRILIQPAFINANIAMNPSYRFCYVVKMLAIRQVQPPVLLH